MAQWGEGSTSVLPSVAQLSFQRFELQVVQGPDAGAPHEFAQENVQIGTARDNDLVLTDRTVSRRHAALELRDASLRIVDLDSSNGTWVNGLQVQGATLRGGERIALGSTVLAVTLASAPRPIEASNETSFGRVLGASAEMRRLYPTFAKLAATTTVGVY